MNEYYSKTVLYAYKSLSAVMAQLDDLVLKKAVASMVDFSPCEKIAEKILDITAQKDVIYLLKEKTALALSKLTDDERLILDYKYFKSMGKDAYAELDFTSRAYFRKQIRVAVKFGNKLSALGIDDAFFEQYCLKIDFFRELYKRVLIREKNFAKIKAKSDLLSIAERSA